MQTKKGYIPIIAGLLFLLNIYIAFREFIGDIIYMFIDNNSLYRMDSLIPVILNILFAVFLFIGNKKLLLIPVGLQLLERIYPFFLIEREFYLAGLVYMLPSLLLFFCIIISCTEKRKILKYIWFLPSVVLLILSVDQIGYYYIECLLEIVAVGLAGYWLTLDENLEEVITNGYYNMRKHVLLLIFTLGIWELIWVYRMTVYLNCTGEFGKRSPKKQMLMFMLVPFYSVYWYYQNAKKVDNLAEKNGIKSDISLFCLFLSLARYLHSLFGIASPIIIQNKINSFSKKPRLSEDGERMEE